MYMRWPAKIVFLSMFIGFIAQTHAAWTEAVVTTYLNDNLYYYGSPIESHRYGYLPFAANTLPNGNIMVNALQSVNTSASTSTKEVSLHQLTFTAPDWDATESIEVMGEMGESRMDIDANGAFTSFTKSRTVAIRG